jgi:hypothetical protein
MSLGEVMLGAEDSDCRLVHLSLPEPHFVPLIDTLESVGTVWNFCQFLSLLFNDLENRKAHQKRCTGI